MIDCQDDGQIATMANLGKRLNLHRITVWKLQRRHPGLVAWVDGVLREANTQLWGQVERRMGQIALQGSHGHADQYCRMTSGYYQQRAGGGGLDPLDYNAPRVIHNYLVPRPEYPQGALAAPVKALIPRPDVPTVAVR